MAWRCDPIRSREYSRMGGDKRRCNWPVVISHPAWSMPPSLGEGQQVGSSGQHSEMQNWPAETISSCITSFCATRRVIMEGLGGEELSCSFPSSACASQTTPAWSCIHAASIPNIRKLKDCQNVLDIGRANRLPHALHCRRLGSSPTSANSRPLNHRPAMLASGEPTRSCFWTPIGFPPTAHPSRGSALTLIQPPLLVVAVLSLA